MVLDFCRERHRTRDRLLEYDTSIMPSYPHTAGLPIIYPWENINLAQLLVQLYAIAQGNGFPGTLDEFKDFFGVYLGARSIEYDYFINFPEEGETNKLYFDLGEKILYYWDTAEYIPVNAMLIANTTLEGGGA